MSVQVRFWGVRGSVPSPLTSADVEKKVLHVLEELIETGRTSFYPNLEVRRLATEKRPYTYGGNTSCVEVRDGKNIFVLDMGTGLRPFGNSLFAEIFKAKGITVNFITSHVHWDHIQGFPFFGPLYLNKEKGFKNSWRFFGGTRWQKTVETCLSGQMDPPTFPISWKEIEQTTHQMMSKSVHDGLAIPMKDGPAMIFGKLNHPQETYGVRLEFPDGPVIAYTTDNEPYNPMLPDPRLVALAKDADVWVTDCQYTQDQYNGKEGGVPRHGWGHSYPEAVAATALQAKTKLVVLFHHDPASSDEKITEVRAYTEKLIRDGGGQQKVIAAWEGLEFTV